MLGRLSAMLRGPASLPDASEVRDAHALVRTICSEAIAASDHWQKKLSDSPAWLALKDAAPDVQVAVTMAAAGGYQDATGSRSGNNYHAEALCTAMLTQLLRRNLPFSASVLARLLSMWTQQRYGLEFGFPGRSVLSAVERFAEQQPLDGELRSVLTTLRKMANRGNYGGAPTKAIREIADRIDRLLDGTANVPALPAGAFATGWQAFVVTRPAAEQPHWQALAVQCASSAGKTQPSGKWQAAGTTAMVALDQGVLTQTLIHLLASTIPDPARVDDSLDLLKGLVWLAPQLDHAALAGPVGRFAEFCFRKVPNHGARSISLGNAALWALSAMAEGPHAAAELFRLAEKIKYPSARAQIAKRLAALARNSGQSLAALEDVGLPDHGIDAAGMRVEQIGEASARIRLTATATDLAWHDAAGKPLKSVPAAVRNQHKPELAAVRKTVADIEAARAGQVARLEASWIERRDWAFADWQAHYLGHPVRRPIVAALIWDVGSTAVLPVDGRLETLDGTALIPAPDARVRLWHPLLADPATVLAWRQRIIAAGLTQPIRQAHREIYVLTDAERQTAIYSNRFAAHILRQHQFRALCLSRGWDYQLMGQFDSWSLPSRPLPAHGLTAQYQVEPVGDGAASASGILLHLASDQLRFVGADGAPVPLERIDPLLLSEVMRDCDLFVAVTSVANDPGWTDGGPGGRFGQYWLDHAFGELGQSATMRRELIARIAPRLSIAAQLEIGERTLIVTGKRHRYAIHFGSSNIQILPANRYLCIVPDGAPAESRNLALPFAGDNLVSIILAKAFLLADESRITDRTILSQL
ncbi:DUF4132 domain-containing protein [Sandarakinorhabdus oryzae]|uniref:DUF4132 domain-containing protein n=1 Tax=Sandarakinorhabdus oryzae TaxID=2675220 RepID=UPI001A9C301F|nr:DUF4132 domain-containing protein [Sandarakinorhabdus oryzae]